jgi:Fic family protein
MKQNRGDPQGIKRMNIKKDILFAANKLKSQLVYDMAKAEGNTHTISEVMTIVEGVTVGGKKLQEQQQVIQIAKAWEYLIDLVKNDQFVFNKRTACELNQLATAADHSKVGQLRDRAVGITGTDYKPPMFNTLNDLWPGLEKQIKSEKDPKMAGYNAFLEIARNQFFNDGNKRTGQFMMNGLLMINNFHVVTFPDKILPEYFDKLIRFYETGDKTQMIDLLNRRQKSMEMNFSKVPTRPQTKSAVETLRCKYPGPEGQALGYP